MSYKTVIDETIRNHQNDPEWMWLSPDAFKEIEDNGYFTERELAAKDHEGNLESLGTWNFYQGIPVFRNNSTDDQVIIGP